MTEASPAPTTPNDESTTPASWLDSAFLLDLVHEVNQGASRERVFTLVADALRHIFAIDRFALVLAQEDGLRMALSLGLSTHYIQTAHQKMAETAGARALAERRPWYIYDAPASPDFWPLQDAARQEGFRTVLILPLFAGPEPLGYLIMYHNATRQYVPTEIVLAQALAQQAAFAVHHARLAAETEERRRALEQAFQQRVTEAEAIDDILLRISSSLDLDSTLDTITITAAQLSDAATASIYLRDPDGMYRAKSAHGIPLTQLQTVELHENEGLLAELCRTGRPAQVGHYGEHVRASDTAMEVVSRVGVHATLGVPLLDGNRCTGALYVATTSATPFSDDAIHVLNRLAAFAQVAVQNARRFSTIQAELSQLQGYIDAIPEGVIIFDRDGTIVLVNNGLQRDLGNSAPLVGHSRRDVLANSARYAARPTTFHYDPDIVFQRVLETGQSEQGLLEMADPPQTYEIHFAPVRRGTQPVEGVVATLRDITVPLELERQRSRANLLAQLLDLSALLNSDLSVPVLVERVVEVATTLIGAGAGTLGLIEGDRLVFRRFRQPTGWIDFDVALEPGQGAPGLVWQTVAPYVSNDCAHDPRVLGVMQKRLGFQQLVCVPVINRSGRVLGTLGVYDPVIVRRFDQRDVEALQLLAHQVAIAIENARLNEMRDAFLSIVSHELKTPVTSIKGFAQVLQRRLATEADNDEPPSHSGAPANNSTSRYLAVINQQTDRLTALINDLLDLSRIQTGRFHFSVGTLDYHALVQDVIAEMELIAPNNAFHLEAGDEPAQGIGNGNRLRQVLVNLIENGIRHGPPGGAITLTISAQNGEIVTGVQDEGPGIPPGEEERIFGPYYQVHSGAEQPARGLGLGLYISRQIVDEHGGRIWVDAEHRSTFCFTIPAVQPTTPAARADLPTNAPIGRPSVLDRSSSTPQHRPHRPSHRESS